MAEEASISQDTAIKGLEWISERIPYPGESITGDTFPMTWADDNELYASAGDPLWGGPNGAETSGLDIEKLCGAPGDYTISRPNIMSDYTGYGGDGPKPSGMICVDGILYMAFQNLLGKKQPAHGDKSQHGSDAHIIASADHGIHWEPGFHSISAPMFPGNLFGGPAFINFGKNNENAKDEYVYAVSADQWDNGSELRLGRVLKDRILEKDSWRFVKGIGPSQAPEWTNQLNESQSVLTSPRSIGLPEMVYLKNIDRYLLATWRLHQDFSSTDGTDLFLYEASEPWGPFSLVYEEKDWEGAFVNPYCPRIPLKWMEPDGITGWMQFSGSWNSPHDHSPYHGIRPYYRSNIRKFRLLLE